MYGGNPMVAQVRTTGNTNHRCIDRASVLRMLREGHTVDEVAFMFDLPRRDVRRMAKRVGAWK